MLQPQPAGGQQDDRAKHKFMVQWVAVPSNYSDDVENFVRIGLFLLLETSSLFLVETRCIKTEGCPRFQVEMCLL